MDAYDASCSDRPLCSSCVDLFIQPTQEPDAKRDLDPLKSSHRRLGRDVLASAYAGCQFCTVVWSKVTSSLRRQVENMEEITIAPDLCWYANDDEFGALVYWVQVGERMTGSIFPEIFTIELSLENGK